MLSDVHLSRSRAGILGHKAFRICFLVLVLLGAAPGDAQAASEKTPLYLLLKADISTQNAPENAHQAFLATGDLWKWTGDGKGKLIQVSHWGFNDVPVPSPNGNYIAYQSMPQITIDYMKSDASHAAGIVLGALPFNLWVLNTQTDQARRITEQSQSAHIDLAKYNLADGTTRSAPAWSPDGRKIAWIEADSTAAMRAMDEGTFVPQLMVYDLATGQTQILANRLSLPDYESPQAGGTAIGNMTPHWGRAGIAIGYRGSNGKQTYTIYDLMGHLQRELKDDNPPIFPGHVWVDDGHQEYLGLRRDSRQDALRWSLYDITAGKTIALDGRIEGYSLLATKGNSLRVSESGYWELVRPDHTAQELTDCSFADDSVRPSFAISPDGELVACLKLFENTVAIYNKTGLLTQLPLDKNLFLGMAWGPVGWRIVRNTR